jgi:hypothetical protein
MARDMLRGGVAAYAPGDLDGGTVGVADIYSVNRTFEVVRCN